MPNAVSRRAQRTPDDIALSDETTAYTWAELAGDLDRAAAAMLALAPDPSERIAVLGDNAAHTLLAHAAGLTVGVGTAATSRQLTAPEMMDQWRDCQAVAAISGPSSTAAASVAADQLGLRAHIVHGIVATGTAIGWDDWIAASPGGAAAGDRPAHPVLVYTSGTTGRPRGAEVRWTKRSYTTAQEYLDAFTGDSSYPAGPHLVVGPLQHNAPLTSLRHLLSGEPVVVMNRFDPETVLATIERLGVTSTTMVPTHFQRLLSLGEDVRKQYDVSSVALVTQTGSACPPDTKQAMIDWFGPVLVESYGGSEVGTVSRISSPEWLEHRGSVGRALAPFEVVVVGENNEPVGPGQVGVLGFRSPPEFAIRYHADEAKTASAFILPGVFTLGDVGYVDADGYIFITDRIADMVVSGGVNLYPAESEKVLHQHPHVADVAVIGVPDSDMGEALLALVVTDGEPVEPGELEKFCRASLASYKCPRTYDFVGQLPRNAMGKIDKKVLRLPYWDSDRTIAG